MPTNDNWKVDLARDYGSENLWVATASRGDFSFTQKLTPNEGEITEFCVRVRIKFKEFEEDKLRGKKLAQHFDDILEREDQREADELVAAEKAAADALVQAQLAKEQADRDAAAQAEKDKAAAEAVASEAAAAAAQPVIETPDVPPVEPLPAPAAPEVQVSDTPKAEDSNEKVS